MLWNDSINNEGDLSRSHHNLHFKAHRHLPHKEQAGLCLLQLKFFTKLPSNQPQRRVLAPKLTLRLLALISLSAL